MEAERWLWRLPPLNLAMCRIVTGLWVLVFAWRWGRPFVRACTLSPAEQFRPVGVVTLIPGPVDADVFHALVVVLLGLAVAFTLGVGQRVVGPIFGLLLLFVLTYRNSWGFIYHTDNSLVFAGLVLGFTPCADALSIDAWRGRTMVDDAEPRDLRYGWPVQLMVLVACIAYAVAGWSKVGAAGLAWADGDTLRGQILRNAYWYEFIAGHAPASTLAVLAWPGWIYRALSTFSLTLELGAPLCLLDRRIVLAFAVAMFGFHWGVMLTMGIPFVYHLYGAAFVAFVPWDWLVDAVRRNVGKDQCESKRVTKGEAAKKDQRHSQADKVDD